MEGGLGIKSLRLWGNPEAASVCKMGTSTQYRNPEILKHTTLVIVWRLPEKSVASVQILQWIPKGTVTGGC